MPRRRVVPQGPKRQWDKQDNNEDLGEWQRPSNHPLATLTVAPEVQVPSSDTTDPNSAASMRTGAPIAPPTEVTQHARLVMGNQDEDEPRIAAFRRTDLPVEQGSVAEATNEINHEIWMPDVVPNQPRRTLSITSCMWALLICVVALSLYFWVPYFRYGTRILQPTLSAISTAISDIGDIKRLAEDSPRIRFSFEPDLHTLHDNLLSAQSAVGSLDTHMENDLIPGVILAWRTGRCDKVHAAQNSTTITLGWIRGTRAPLDASKNLYNDHIASTSQHLSELESKITSLDRKNPYSTWNQAQMIYNEGCLAVGPQRIEEKRRDMEELKNEHESTKERISKLKYGRDMVDAEEKRIGRLTKYMEAVNTEFTRSCVSTESEPFQPRSKQSANDTALCAAPRTLFHALLNVSDSDPAVAARHRKLDG
ncbi:MAG: hypothetical protein Q9180_003524 [Flavoplaca navasiana]